MLHFDRIDVSEGIDFNKKSTSKECDIWYFYYWYFLNHSSKFQPNVCNRCLDLLMMSMNLSDVAITGFIKNDAVNVIQNAELTEKAEHFKA